MTAQDDFGKEFGLDPDVCVFELNRIELDLLLRQDPGTQHDGGWQSLLVTLQGLLDDKTNRIFVPRHVRERIRMYAFKYGQGGWESRLVGIFGRHLGPKLDGRL